MSINRIVVAGGGTAGWLTAHILDRRLNASHRAVEITVIEPSSIGRIGVGEATVPSIVQTLQELGIREAEFMRKTSATFKHAIRFEGWHQEPGAKNNFYYHTFERNEADVRSKYSLYEPRELFIDSFCNDISAVDALFGYDAAHHRYSYTTGVQPFLCDLNLAPKLPDMTDFDGYVQYAYHLDAEAFADYLRDLGQRRGIQVIDDVVTEAELASTNRIGQLKTQSGHAVQGDFFVDCTGFRSLLLGGALGVKFKSFSQYLACDRAVAMRAPRLPGEPRPYTTSTAQDAGWIWDIDLTSRRGVGYVYSSSFLSDEGAEQALRTYVGPAGRGLDVRRLDMPPGCREQFWVGNCAAIGLSGGFVEPLESTGIYLIEQTARRLADSLMFRQSHEVSSQYNQYVRLLYEEIVDFISLHYAVSQRRDTPFWQHVTRPASVPTSLAQKLKRWEDRPPCDLDTSDRVLPFPFESYKAVLYGMGCRHNRTTGIESDPHQTRLRNQLRLISEASEIAKQTLPAHSQLLNAIKQRGRSDSITKLSDVVAARSEPTRKPQQFGGSIKVRLSAMLHHRLQMAPGTEFAPMSSTSPQCSQAPYAAAARIPVDDWRDLTSAEVEQVNHNDGHIDVGSTVQVVKFSGSTATIVAKLRRLLKQAGEDVSSLFQDSELQKLKDQLEQEIETQFNHDPRKYRSLGFYNDKPDLRTTTRDHETNKFIGLHVDSWSRLGSMQRDRAPNRIAINLGQSPRYLLFMDLSVAEIVQLTAHDGDGDKELNPTETGRIFMRRFNRYPVLRLQILPGEAYIAPTENLIHDGSTAGSATPDIMLSLLGQFR